MNEPTIALAIGILRDAYPRQDFPDNSVTLYAGMLADLDDEQVVAAVKRLVRRSTFLPSIAEIREEVATATLDLPTADEAWEMLNEPDWTSMHPLVRAAANALGGKWTLRMSTSPQILRAQFQKDYSRRRELAILREMGAAAPSARSYALPTGENVVELRTYHQEEPVGYLPVSESIYARPIWGRVLRRRAGLEVAEPTEAEKGDAIRVLEANIPGTEALIAEATAILDVYGR